MRDQTEGNFHNSNRLPQPSHRLESFRATLDGMCEPYGIEKQKMEESV